MKRHRLPAEHAPDADPLQAKSKLEVARPGLIVAYESTRTTCDPAHPVYRLTASGIEVVPDDCAPAYDATFWLGGTRSSDCWQSSCLFGVQVRRPGVPPKFGYDQAGTELF